MIGCVNKFTRNGKRRIGKKNNGTTLGDIQENISQQYKLMIKFYGDLSVKASKLITTTTHGGLRLVI